MGGLEIDDSAGDAVSVAPGYELAAGGREEAEDQRMGLLESIYDGDSRRRRDLVQPGWRCLEVGAGRGSMSTWLAQQVGDRGHVVATDIDVTYLERLDVPNLEVRRHNILEDSLDALSPGSFDLVCCRFLLFHLRGRQETAIQRMAQCLRPGGWLIDEDGDWSLAGPVDPSHPLYDGYHRVFAGGRSWTARGFDMAFGRKLPALFERAGLENIRHQASTEVVRGGSPWARWWQESLDVMQAAGEQDGSTSERSDEDRHALSAPSADPSVWYLRELLHTCWGQRPLA